MRRCRVALGVLGLASALVAAPAAPPPRIDVTVHEGTSMSVAVSPDGRTLAIDLQGSLWTLPSSGGTATRITDLFNDARQPTWSPDGKWITYFAYRDGGYDVWAVAPDGSNQHKLTWGPFDDREPIWSHDGTRVAFSSDRGSPLGSDYNIWTLDVKTRELRQMTKNAADENVFAFRASWASPTTFYYVSDGKIRRRDIKADRSDTIEFSATLQVTRAADTYVRRKRDFTSTAPRQALGIVRPAISPDGKQIAFAAVGDIYVMPVGGKPVNLTKNAALDTDPAWSPDGSQLAYSSDRDSEHLQLWVRDMKSGQARRLTDLTTQPQGAAWSPDGRRIAFFNVDGMWRVAQMSVVDVATGQVTRVHDSLPQPGAPTWSPDGRRLAIAGIAPMTRRFREGTNQILTMSADVGRLFQGRQAGGEPERLALQDDKWFAPEPMLSIDSRGGCGPAWS